MRYRISITLSLLAAAAVFPETASGQLRPNSAFRQFSVSRNDDGSGPLEDIGFAMNFFGRTRSSLYVNNNGNVTLDGPLSTYTPFGLVGVRQEIIAVFFADVDTRGPRSALVTYGRDLINGRKAFGVNYVNVGYYNSHDDKLNSFQLVLIERPDTGALNFDIEFNYERIVWETGDASGGVNGFGGVPAAVGWSNGSGEPGTSYELPGSRVPGSFLDGASGSLVRRRVNSTTTGRYVFRAREGQIYPGLSVSSGCPMPAAVIGVPYSYKFDPTGGAPPFRWTLEPDPGMAMPGLSLNADGAMSGTPSRVGTYEFTLRVTGKGDEGGEETAFKRCSVTVAAQQLNVVTACPLPAGTAGVPYSTSNQVSGGRAPYAWSLIEGFGALPSGLTINEAGAISGTPVTPGTYRFTLRVGALNSEEAVAGTKACSITIHSPGLRTETACPLPAATTGVPYSADFGAAGGTEPYAWSIAGALPVGVALSPDGRITGTPLVAGSYDFVLSLRDSRGVALSLPCGISVGAPQLDITSACPLPAATAGVPYASRLEVGGGAGPYRWSVFGTLPQGLWLSPDGVVTGTPRAPGPAWFRLKVEDSQGKPAALPCSLVVNPGPFAITSCPLADARAGEVYQQNLDAVGGAEPYLWWVSGGMPAGLSLSPSGALVGTPAVPGRFEFNARVSDSRSQTASRSCAVTVLPAPPRVTTACPLPEATLGQAYSLNFEARDGSEPYGWSPAGDLPAGLTLNGLGQLRGTPSALGTFPVHVRLADARGETTARECALRVMLPPLPSIKVADLPASLTPAAPGFNAGIELSRPYPLAIEGVLTLSVEAETGSVEASVNRADPRVRFMNGQRTTRFVIPPGTMRVSVPLASTGTVATAITVNAANLTTAGAGLPLQPPPRTVRVPRLAPVITDGCFVPGTGGMEVAVSGYSTTRSLASAEVGVSGTSYPVDLSAPAGEYYASDESVRFGSTFSIRFPVRLPAASQAPTSVQVAVANVQGRSATRQISRCP
jgi:hypothetical protein